MTENRPEEPRRASATMYDPARDLYTGHGLDRSAEHQRGTHDVGHEEAGLAVNPRGVQSHSAPNPSDAAVGRAVL
jgi:hypothetical protein